MTLLEKLKELSAQATPGAWDVNPDGAEEWWYSDTIVSSGGVLASCVRGNAELITLSRNHIDSLIAVAEAAVKYISKRVEYAGYERQYEILKRVENKTTMQEMEMSTVDAERERAELELCDAWDNLVAALAALEVEA